MSKPKTLQSKKITGQLGENLIERVVLQMGYIWQSHNAELDVGIDGTIEIVTPDGHATGCIIQVQSKAEQRFTRETDSSFEYLCVQDDLDYWMRFNTPVVLVVSRSRSLDEAYWVDVKGYFADPKVRASRRVTFDKKADHFSSFAAGALRELAVPRDAGLHFPPPPKRESLLSNLLEVKPLPQHVYIADADVGKYEVIWGRAREMGVRLPDAWLLNSRQVWSVHDLREPPWDEVLGRCSVETNDAGHFAWSEDRGEAATFAQLLRQCLHEMTWPLGVKHQKRGRDHVFFFMSGHDNASRQGRWRSAGNPFTLFGPQLKKDKSGEVSYYLHHAFAGRFRRLGEAWFLEIEPTYHYTRDGRRESRFAASLLSGKMRLDRNPAVAGGVQLWAATLTGRLTEVSNSEDSPLFGDAKAPARRWAFEPHPHLAFGELLTVECPVGLSDADWLKREDDAARVDADESATLFGSWDDQGGEAA